MGSPPLLEDLALSQGESKPSAPKVLDIKATPGRSFLHAEDFLLPHLVIDTQPAAPQDIIRFVSASSPSRKEKHHTLTHTPGSARVWRERPKIIGCSLFILQMARDIRHLLRSLDPCNTQPLSVGCSYPATLPYLSPLTCQRVAGLSLNKSHAFISTGPN